MLSRMTFKRECKIYLTLVLGLGALCVALEIFLLAVGAR